MWINSSRLLGAAVILATALVVSGCGSSSKSGTSGSSASGSNASPLKVAIIQPYTGDSAYYGDYANQAFKLAMAKFGSKPGGHPLSFVRGDSKCVPTSAVQAGNQVLASSPVAMLAPACSGDTLALAPLLKARGVPACSINLAPTIVSEGGGQIVRIAPSDTYTNDLFAKYMAAAGVKKIGIVHDTSGYGQGNSDTLVAALKKANIAVAVNATYDFDSTDYSGQIIKLKKAGVDATYFEGYDLAVGNLVKQAKQLQLKGKYFANTNAGNETAGKAAGSALDGVEFATAFLPDASQAAGDFAATWQQQFNAAANSGSVDLYQCAAVIIKAIEGAGPNADGKSVAAAMKKVSIPDLPTASVAFTPEGELTSPPVLIGTWDSGKTKLVKRLSGGQ
jgi:branched-chain amino acid transport system substrate-binding protein